MSKLLPFWANALLVLAVLGILVAAVLVRKKCTQCGTPLREVSASDPLSWRWFTIRDIPRLRTVHYRCDRCGTESIQKELTGGEKR
jgi:hypothetical protein